MKHSPNENPGGGEFLQELWRHKSELEHGEMSENERAVRVYIDIKKAIGKNNQLEKIFKTLEDAALNYMRLVLRLNRAKLESDPDPVMIEKYDEHRRLGHNRLIDDVNLLSREFKKAGLDNSWRNDVGLSREAIGDWARQVAQFLEKILFRRKSSFHASFDERCLTKALRDFGSAQIELKEACRQKYIVLPAFSLNDVCMLYSA